MWLKGFTRSLFKIYWTPCAIVCVLMCLLFIYAVNRAIGKGYLMQNVLRRVIPDAQYNGSLPLTTPSQQKLSDEITVVTAYWNLGRFQKGGSISNQFDTPLYHKWAGIYRYLMNPLVVYTDSNEFAQLINSLRNLTVHRTKLLIISRNSSWAFRNVERIRQIFSIQGYPKHHPNTVVPEYPCSQHAKYDVTARAARDNFFHTNYFAWLDVGYFRDRKSLKPFQLIRPKGFNESLIAMNEISRQIDLPARTIFRANKVWVGGGLFLGQRDVILAHEVQFKRAVDYFISQNVTNTDQQVLLAMYSNEGVKELRPTTKLQAYMSGGDWFHLGKTMVKEINT